MATAQSHVVHTHPVLTLSPSPDAATGPCRCQLTLPLVAVLNHLTEFRMSPTFKIDLSTPKGQRHSARSTNVPLASLNRTESAVISSTTNPSTELPTRTSNPLIWANGSTGRKTM